MPSCTLAAATVTGWVAMLTLPWSDMAKNRSGGFGLVRPFLGAILGHATRPGSEKGQKRCQDDFSVSFRGRPRGRSVMSRPSVRAVRQSPHAPASFTAEVHSGSGIREWPLRALRQRSKRRRPASRRAGIAGGFPDLISGPPDHHRSTADDTRLVKPVHTRLPEGHAVAEGYVLKSRSSVDSGRG